jgi:hypothetical protein
MTTGGWINLVLSLGFVLGLFSWCAWKLLHAKPAPDKTHLAHIEPVHDDELNRR